MREKKLEMLWIFDLLVTKTSRTKKLFFFFTLQPCNHDYAVYRLQSLHGNCYKTQIMDMVTNLKSLHSDPLSVHSIIHSLVAIVTHGDSQDAVQGTVLHSLHNNTVHTPSLKTSTKSVVLASWFTFVQCSHCTIRIKRVYTIQYMVV